MTLDNNILGEARTARERLLDLQHTTEVARVDYHHIIRRLHAAGGSLREIAESLGLSHQRVHQIVEPVDGAPGESPAVGRMRRRMRGLVPFERFTSDARDRVMGAIDEAAALGHRRVGSEHLLLSLAGATDGPAGKILAHLGVTKPQIATATTERLGMGAVDTPGRRPFTPAARRVLGRAMHAARRRQDQEITGEHILLGLVEDGGDAAAILTGLGVSAQKVREALEAQ